jgi:hypothetical protein
MRGSRPLLTVSTADRSVLHSAEVVHFHHSSCKSSEELWTQPHMCWSDTIPHFQGVAAQGRNEAFTKICKRPTTHDSYSSRRTITLPSGQHLSKACYPKRTRLYPCKPKPPVFLSDKVTSTIAHLINWLSHSHMDCGCTIFLGGAPCSN